MLPLTGYTNRLSLVPGESIEFKISSSAAPSFEARLVRVRCGDPNPHGPGIREEPIRAAFEGTYPSRVQPVHLGSYARVADVPVLHRFRSFTLVATLWPTTPGKKGQGVISKIDPTTGEGFALVLDGDLGTTALIGDGEGHSVTLSVGKKLRRRVWYRVWATYDAESSMLWVGHAPLVPEHGADDAGMASRAVSFTPSIANRHALLIGAVGGAPVGGHYNGKIEHPILLGRALIESERARAPMSPAPGGIVGEWDFSREMESIRIIDRGPYRLHGELVNLPARAMTGSSWTGAEMCWRHAPEQYGAIHFHDDDLYDCGWKTDFTFEVPPDLRSGVYAVRIESGDVEDMIPFFVRPPRGAPQSSVCVLIPTFTYVIYANHARGNTNDVSRERTAAWKARPWTPDEHPEYGLSTYNFHSDGSGICHSTRLRPIITMRSGFMSIPELPGSGLRHFPADTHLLDWLETMGHDFDVVTDDDLHEEGADLIAPYRVVLTTTHPEYHTAETLNALMTYTRGGGRLMYMGGNGFYWRVARHRDLDGVLEIRRGESGIRAWAAEPGEYFNAFDGTYGGLWRRNGRPPQQLAGIGFTAQGRFESSYYRRKPGADDPRAAWIFEGVDDEILGDFGLCGGGAAGYELDRVDHRLGSPENTIVLASSEKPPASFVLVFEDQLTHLSTWSGEPSADLLRADMVYFETANGGAVFSTGSITFCGSLPHNGYDNNISRLVNNVLERFKQPPET